MNREYPVNICRTSVYPLCILRELIRASAHPSRIRREPIRASVAHPSHILAYPPSIRLSAVYPSIRRLFAVYPSIRRLFAVYPSIRRASTANSSAHPRIRRASAANPSAHPLRIRCASLRIRRLCVYGICVVTRRARLVRRGASNTRLHLGQLPVSGLRAGARINTPGARSAQESTIV